jgi:hypothetical protein
LDLGGSFVQHFHRSVQVRNADKIVLIADQSVQAMGSHDELIASSQAYGDLVKRQLQHVLASDETAASEDVEAVASASGDWVLDALIV